MSDKRRDAEAGIALVLALLSLMLLTFLGLGLAATTSTELQIANNYRWGQQAFYNAEAGIEIAKKVLEGTDWEVVLPAARTVPWHGFQGSTGDGDSLTPPEDPAGSRNYESWACDWRGHGMGYGSVLVADGRVYANVSSGPPPYDQNVRGAFTIWVRRVVEPDRDEDGKLTGMYLDSADEEEIVITAEGVAPYSANAGTLVAQQTQAVRMVEATATDAGTIKWFCEFQGGQTGGTEGSGFAKCHPLGPESIGAALGMAGAGELAQSDVR